jgi:hypothetical protein
MAESVAERIMQHLQTTLEGITTVNGYDNTIHSVQRFQQEGQDPIDGNGVLLIDGDDIVEGTVLAGDYDLIARQRHIDLVVIGRQDLSVDSRSASAAMNSLENDIRKALQVDYTRGGLAVNTEETQANETDVQIGMPELRRAIGYEIRYRHRRTDPSIAG